MSGLWNKWTRRLCGDERGVSAVEFGLALPVLLLMTSGLVEIGRAHSQADTLEKAIRGAAEYAARNEFPLTAGVRTQVENLVRTGTLDGTGATLVPGLAGTGGSITISTSSYDPGSGTAVPIVRVGATVPYQPLLSGLMAMVGLDSINIEASHDQPYLGT